MSKEYYDELVQLDIAERDKRREEILKEYRLFSFVSPNYRLVLSEYNMLGIEKRTIIFPSNEMDGISIVSASYEIRINVLLPDDNYLVPSYYRPVAELFGGGKVYIGSTPIEKSDFWGVMVFRKEENNNYSYLLKLNGFTRQDEAMDRLKIRRNY